MYVSVKKSCCLERWTEAPRTRMVLDEREFYRRGVFAVMVDALELEPGEATQVMVVLEAPDA